MFDTFAVPELKHNYTARRPSLSSSISSTMTDPLSPLTPYTPSPGANAIPPAITGTTNTNPLLSTTSQTSTSNEQQKQSDSAGAVEKPVTTTASTAQPPPKLPPSLHPPTLGAKVVSQSESLTKFEVSDEMQAMLQSRKVRVRIWKR